MRDKRNFSIIVPLYNCEETIDKVISCLKNQDYPQKKYEIICIDDRSEDQTVSLVRKTEVKLIKLSKNGGNGGAKNFAIRKARGEILLLIDDHLYLDKNALSSLDSLFNKYPNISGICGLYKSLKKSDMNICRDIRRRTIYGKAKVEKEISLKSFSPFSIVLGAVKKEVFKNLRFPENFGKDGAEDILFQINCHHLGKNFLYSPEIKGIHDHSLGYKDILGKLFAEVRGLGNLIHYFVKKDIELPFQFCFLSYPLFLMIGFGLWQLDRLFLPFFLIFFVIEIIIAAQCFKDKTESLFLRFKAFGYCFLEEIIKGFYLPYYLIKKGDFNFGDLARSFYQFLKWEKEKLTSIFNLLFKIEQIIPEYAKI